MAVCDTCGNDYDKAFQVTKGGKTMTFDSFECAIEALAPRCAHCQCRVVGHGLLFRALRHSSQSQGPKGPPLRWD